MAWLYLVSAGLLEIGWAMGLKFSHGFTRITPTIVTFVLMGGSFFLLARAMKSLPLGTAYAVWTGIGTVGTAALGMMVFGEAVSLSRIMFIACIVIGIVGLKLVN